MKYLPHPDYIRTQAQVDAIIDLYGRGSEYKYITCWGYGWYFFNNPKDIIYPISKTQELTDMVDREISKVVAKLLTSRLPRNYVPSKATT